MNHEGVDVKDLTIRFGRTTAIDQLSFSLTYELINHQQWKLLLTEHDYALLQAPAAKTSQPK